MSNEKADGWVSPRWRQNMEEAGDCHLNLNKPQEGFRPVKLVFLDEPKSEEVTCPLAKWILSDDKAKNHIPDAEKMVDGWIPCSERLPEFGDKILVYYPSGFYCVRLCSEGREDDYGMCEVVYRDEIGDLDDDEFTHWMPLPAAPKGEV